MRSLAVTRALSPLAGAATPSVGLLAEAYGLRSMRPARNAARPASTPSFMAAAMSGGSCDFATAVLMSTASAPISIASAASDGAPMPASTTTGTCAFSMMILISSSVRIPWPEPMAEPSGITVAQPASSRCLASTGSAWMYGSTTKPSAMSCSAARSVPMGSGSRYLGSGITSSFTQLEPVTERPRRAVRSASSTVLQPAVLGSTV